MSEWMFQELVDARQKLRESEQEVIALAAALAEARRERDTMARRSVAWEEVPKRDWLEIKCRVDPVMLTAAFDARDVFTHVTQKAARQMWEAYINRVARPTTGGRDA